MNYQKIKHGAYNLHMIKTDKFKTITVRVTFRKPIQKENITIRNFLSDMMTLSTKKYKTKRLLSIKAQELYGASVSAVNYRLGSDINTSFYLKILNEKFSEEGMFEESLAFFSDLIFKPNVENQMFDETSFQIVKNNTQATLKSLKENSSQYSMIRLLEEMDPKSPFSYRSFGYEEDLEKITKENLYQFYQEMIKTNLVDIFVIGEIDFDNTETLIKKYFPFNTLKKNRDDVIIPCTNTPKKIRTKKEQEQSKQSKLAIGCRIVNITEQERKYPLTLYNIILGGGADSKLFQEVREKNSLAYTIRSVTNKLDNLLLITAGISKENFDKTVELIKKEMNEMNEGNFSDEDIEKAKQLFVTAITESEDSPEQIIESHFMMHLLNTDDNETRKKKMLEVTKEEIVQVAKKIKIDMIYLLEGNIENEEN